MLKGVVRPDIIATMLGLGTRQVQRYQERVEAALDHHRGEGRNIARFRGEALARLDLVESEAWAAYGAIDNQRDPSVRDRVKVLGLIASLQDQRSALLGLSPKVIERIRRVAEPVCRVAGTLRRSEGLGRHGDPPVTDLWRRGSWS